MKVHFAGIDAGLRVNNYYSVDENLAVGFETANFESSGSSDVIESSAGFAELGCCSNYLLCDADFEVQLDAVQNFAAVAFRNFLFHFATALELDNSEIADLSEQLQWIAAEG